MEISKCLLTIALLLCMFTFGLQTPLQKNKNQLKTSPINDELCTSKECVIAAANILETIDETVDPCHDFYSFACGGFIDATQIPDTNSNWGQFSVLSEELSKIISNILNEPININDAGSVKKAKEFYLGCINIEQIDSLGIQPLVDFLDKFGGWPMIQTNWEPTNFDWADAVADTKRIMNTNYLINIYVYIDAKDVFSTVMYIDQPSLGLSQVILLNPDDFTANVDAYKQYMRTTAKLLANEPVDQIILERDIDDVFTFETKLAAMMSLPEERRDGNKLYNDMTIQHLQDSTTSSSINWLDMLNRALYSSGRYLTSESVIIVREPTYFQDLLNLIDSTEPRIISNYLGWRHVKNLASESTTEMRDAAFQYSRVIDGVTDPRAIENSCADLANAYIGYAIGTKYIENYFTEKAKDDITIMIDDFRDTFKNMISESSWMDDGTKPIAQEKVDTISNFIAYPDWYKEFEAVDSYYKILGIMDVNNHLKNILACKLYFSTDEMDALEIPAERIRWITHPTVVNAFYNPPVNSINFPAAILQPPFSRVNTLQVLNYGGIGQVIGHEISHGFDDQGRQNDINGNLLQWWSNETVEAFKEEAQCFVDQYGSYVHPQIQEPLNGVNTLGENIADNGGLRQAYYAYQKYVLRNGAEQQLPGLEHYSANQLLFIAGANIWCTKSTDEYILNRIQNGVHSPGMFRVIGPVSNMPEFSETFNCAAEDEMNPKNKCLVW